MADPDSITSKVTEGAKRTGEAMRESGKSVAQGGSELGTKIVDQLEANMKEAFAAMRQAAQAKDISEVMKIQGEFLREQGSRSMSQARELGEMIVQIGKDAVAPLKGAADANTKGS